MITSQCTEVQPALSLKVCSYVASCPEVFQLRFKLSSTCSLAGLCGDATVLFYVRLQTVISE